MKGQVKAGNTCEFLLRRWLASSTLVLSFLIFAHACRDVPDIVLLADSVRFKVRHVPVHIARLAVYGSITTQTLTMRVGVDDRSDEEMSVSPEQFVLITSDGNRSTPIRTKVLKDTIEPGVSRVFVLTFEPVHSRELYQRTGLRGDLETSYKLEVGNDGEPITLVADVGDDRFLDLLALHGLGATTTAYLIDVTNKNYHRTSPTSTIHISESEILYNGLWMKLQAIHRHDSLALSMRFVNQTGRPLTLEGKRLRVRSNNQWFNNAVAFPQSLEIVNGGRGEMRVSIACKNESQLILDFTKFHLGQGDFIIELFDEPITLKELNISLKAN